MDYANHKGYRSIALLNALRKVTKSIMREKISYLAEKYQLLPETQNGSQKG